MTETYHEATTPRNMPRRVIGDVRTMALRAQVASLYSFLTNCPQELK